MRIYQKQTFVYRILLTILSIISVGGFLIDQFNQIKNDQSLGSDWFWITTFSILSLVIAVLYWLNDNALIKGITQVLLVVDLFLILNSFLFGLFGLGASPIFYVVTCFNLILGFIYLNLDYMTGILPLCLFLLKLISSFLSALFGIYCMAVLMTSGGVLLMQSAAFINFIVILTHLIIVLNLAYACLIWFKAYRSWWAWLLTALVTLELWGLDYFMFNDSIVQLIIAGLIVTVLSLLVPFLTNKLSK